jgi:hypothetical protein
MLTVENQYKHSYHTYMHGYIHTYMHACRHASVHPSIHPCMHACMHARIHAYTHTYILQVCGWQIWHLILKYTIRANGMSLCAMVLLANWLANSTEPSVSWEFITCPATEVIPSVLWIPKDFNKSLVLVCILSHMHETYVTSTRFPKVPSNSILPSTARSSHCFAPSKTLYAQFFSCILHALLIS